MIAGCLESNDLRRLESLMSNSTPAALQNMMSIRDDDGNQPLMRAITTGNTDLINLLLRYRKYIDGNARDLESGYTVLHKAFSKGDLYLATFLRSQLAMDPKIKDHEGFNSLEMLEVSIK